MTIGPLASMRENHPDAVILNEAKRSEESNIAACKTTSSVGESPGFLAALGVSAF